MPTKIIYMENVLHNIEFLISGRKALLVTSSGFVDRGLVNKILSSTNNIVKVISNVKTHPDFLDVEPLYKIAYENDFEVIIALGGGSVIDVSKFISVSNKDKDFEFVKNLTKGKIKNEILNIIPLISIPTTAGTGSELTPYSTIWDKKNKKKYSLHLFNLFSEQAVYDPEITLTVPKQITIQTGLDALSHSLESIWNKNANPLTIDYSVKSAKLIINNLPLLSNDLKNITLRKKMMIASMYAGLAISNTQTAIAHAISYYVTTHKAIPHGIACSFLLPHLIDNIIGKYKFIDEAIINIFGELSSKPLRSMFKKLNVSTNFENYGISKDEFTYLVKTIANNERTKNSLVHI